MDILVVEDIDATAFGWQLLFGAAGHDVTIERTFRSGWDTFVGRRFDAIIIDAQLTQERVDSAATGSQENGLTLALWVKQRAPKVGVVVSSAYPRYAANVRDLIRRHRFSGIGFVSKSLGHRILLSAIDDSIAGTNPMYGDGRIEDEPATLAFLDALRTDERAIVLTGYEQFDELTLRERDVAQRITDGLKRSTIAAELGVTVKAVENHVTSIYQKLQFDDRVATHSPDQLLAKTCMLFRLQRRTQ